MLETYFSTARERDDELVCDPLIRATFRHQLQDFALARRQVDERVVTFGASRGES